MVNQQSKRRSLRELLAKHDYFGILERTENLDQRAGDEGWLYRGKALEGLCRPNEAASVYEHGLEDHQCSRQLHLALGQLEIQRGRPRRAIDLLRKGCELDPDNLNCYTALLNLESLDPDGPEAARMLVRALDSRKSDPSRARALFFLGQLNVEAHRDRIGFAFYTAANALALKSIDQSRREYPLPKRLLELSRSDLDAPNSGAPDCRAIVVAGLPRSGKTMVEGMLSDHPHIFPIGEFAGLRRALVKFEKNQILSGVRKLAQEGSSPFTETYASHPLAKVERGWVVDSSPVNLTRLGYFGLVHPDRPVVLCRRKPADLGVSLYFKKFKSGHGYTYDLASIGRAMALTERLIEHWSNILPNPVLVVDYEDLVSDPEGMRRRLFAHIGLELPSLPERAVADTDWRIFPSRSPGPATPISPALIGFSDRFADELKPLICEYKRMKSRLSR